MMVRVVSLVSLVSLVILLIAAIQTTFAGNFDELLAKAESGDIVAQYQVGWMLETGLDTEKDKQPPLAGMSILPAKGTQMPDAVRA
jgi:hypothetical protein